MKTSIQFFMMALILLGACHDRSAQIGLISNIPENSSPARHGLEKLDQQFMSKGLKVIQSAEPAEEGSDFYIVAGLAPEENLATKLLKELEVPLPEGKEALLVRKTSFRGKPAILLCGADETGLMYAALDVARRISWSTDSGDPFKYISDVSEKPDVKERGVSSVTVQRRYFEERLHDSLYWKKYFDMMAENRLNQFLLIFGYKNNQYKEPNFTAPVYPNFFDMEEYPWVKLSGITPEQQLTNTLALKKVIALAHERGIEFGVGLWDQIERDQKYTSMVRDDAKAPADLPPNIIWGLSQKNLIPYTKLAVKKFFRTFPEIDLVQFRMHWESGITGDVALKFWKEIFIILKEENPDLKVEARAKEVPDETLYDGAATGMDFRVATKHWMEQMGMPFHPTHINRQNQHDRRHGYADLLRYPQRYGFKWRLWNGGTTRILLWGDPEWVKLFAEGSHLYDAAGFDFNEPLYFKMNGSPHDAEVSDILNPEYSYYTYEFERYWHFYQLFGRIGYNPDTPSDTWEMEFTSRFGKEAGMYLMEGLHLASKVLPRIVSASYLYARFPSPQGWAEMQRMDDLPDFAANSEPSDIQQFASPMEEAELILSGGISPKRLPSQTSDWFLKTSSGILDCVEQAEKSIGEKRNNEYISTVTDLKMLAYLAEYHAHRLVAAVSYNLYKKTGDLISFDRAIGYETEAVNAYGSLVDAAGDIYNKQLDFGSNKDLIPDHWSIEYERLRDGLEKLEAEKTVTLAGGEAIMAPRINTYSDKYLCTAEFDRLQKASPGKNLKVTCKVQDADGIKSVTLRYRRVNQFEDYQSAAMLAESGSDMYQAIIPGNFIIPEYDLMYFIEVTDADGNGRMLPDLDHETPYLIVNVDRKKLIN